MHRETAPQYFRSLQTEFCTALEQADGGATFRSDPWKRTDNTLVDGGGGLTRILRSGAVFESAGVNFSLVQGQQLGNGSEVI